MIDNPAMTGTDWALMKDTTEADKLMTDLAGATIGTEMKEIDNHQIADKTGTDKHQIIDKIGTDSCQIADNCQITD